MGALVLTQIVYASFYFLVYASLHYNLPWD